MANATVRAVLDELAPDFKALNGSFDEDRVESERRLARIEELLSQVAEKVPPSGAPTSR